MGFQPGNKGRPPAEKAFAAMLRIALAEAHGEGNKLRAVADAVVAEAIGGNVAAINTIADRLDGKPIQQVDASISVSSDAVVEDRANRFTEAMNALIERNDSKARPN